VGIVAEVVTLRGERGGVDRLAEMRAAGLVRQASDHAVLGVEQLLPVIAQLRPLFAGGGLRRGSTIAVTGLTAGGAAAAPGATSLLLGLLAEASASGSWCAAVGLPNLGLLAAAQLGIALDRFALVPQPGPEWAGVVAALLDGLDLVAINPAGPVAASVTSRLAARARQRGSVLVTGAGWPGADLVVEVVRGAWHGLGAGWGRLRERELEVVAYGRGAAARTRRVRMWLPGEELAAPAHGSPRRTVAGADRAVASIDRAVAGTDGVDQVMIGLAG
jgi:hypothetical protein